MKHKRKIIIALAYLHRYGWFALLLVSLYLIPYYLTFFAFYIFYSIWTFIGYKCNWKHIFCSFQNANHQKMTPDSIRWDLIKKSDIWGIILIFAFLGKKQYLDRCKTIEVFLFTKRVMP